jgi:hypothetical protein
MKNTSHGLEKGDTLSYKSYLDNYNAEMSPDTAPTLIPVLDGKNVIMKSYHEELAKAGKVLEAAQDISNSLSTLDIEHHFIHLGRHYFYNRVLTLGSLATTNIVVETGETCFAHFLFGLEATDGAISYITYKDITANADGTLLPIINNNFNATRESDVILRLNPTEIANNIEANIIRNGRAGKDGTPSQRAGGNVERGDEVIFKPNSKYLLTITNLISATNYVNVKFSWYENGQCE